MVGQGGPIIRHHDLRGHFALFAAFALAGTSVVSARLLTGALGTLTITAASLGLLLICLTPIYASRIQDSLRRMTPGQALMLLLQAVFGIVAFRLFLLWGLQRTSAGEAGILTGATPAITSILALLFLKEHPTKSALGGVASTVVGILLLQGLFAGNGRLPPGHLCGNLLVLCAAGSEAVFNVIARKHGSTAATAVGLHPMVQTLLVSALAFALCLGPALGEGALGSLAALGLIEWLALAWYGLVVTAVAFCCFYVGVRRCDAYTTAAYSGMMPLTAMLLSALLLGETMSLTQWLGGLFIIGGMLLIGAGPGRHQPVPQSRRVHIEARRASRQ